MNATYYDRDVTLALEIGCSISLFFITVAFVAIVSSSYLRVKRQYIIAANICVSLLIYYFGFLVSVTSRTQSSFPSNNTTNNGLSKIPTTPACVAGAFMQFGGWFCVLFWLLADWLFLSFNMRMRVGLHISHFFLKTSIPAYGLPLLLLLIAIGINAGMPDSEFIKPTQCWFNLKLGIAITFFLATALCAIGIISCAAFCCVKQTCKKSENIVATTVKKNKRSLFRLTALTLIVWITAIPNFAFWALSESHKHLEDYGTWLAYLDSFFIGTEGLLIVICLAFRSKDFKSYWVAVLKGRYPSSYNNASIHTKTSTIRRENNIGGSQVDVVSESRQNPKFEPREGKSVELTPDDEAFLSTTINANVSQSSPDENASNRAWSATLDIESQSSNISPKSSTGHPPEKLLDPIGTLQRLKNLRKTIIRASPMSPKPRESPSPMTSPKSPKVRNGKPQKFVFNRAALASMSMKGEREKKTSF